ncbi:MAG: hypothetical protein HYV32_05280 [Candidatus Kerfeldbacteria bacterium]|nr:hypothetical protein [Candidatus Kerfeldbacteria bacterium]
MATDPLDLPLENDQYSSTSNGNMEKMDEGNADQNTEGIDFEKTTHQVQLAIQYVNETRADFEQAGPQPWVNQLIDILNTALKSIHELEMVHVDDLVDWTDEFGDTHQIMVRLVDEEGFDRVMNTYTSAEKQFEEYFNKHLKMIGEETA